MFGCMREPESEEKSSKSYGKDRTAGRGASPFWQSEKRILFKVTYSL